jgi:hypothetical protein
MLGHSGWGETLFLKDVFPDTPLRHYFDFFASAPGKPLSRAMTSGRSARRAS